MAVIPPRFYLSNLTYHPYAGGYQLVATSDVPCHLWMRWTLQKPLTHTDPRFRRGIAIPGETRFCFVVFEDNEQIEAGDTLIHTFHKKNWPVCQTRYFYFQGTIAGVTSPSTTAIFTKHRTEDWTMHKELFYPNGYSGWAEGTPSPSWPTIREEDKIGGFINGARTYLRAAILPPNYLIRRTVLRFDTSAIPLTATVLFARISQYLFSKSGFGGASIRYGEVSGLPPLSGAPLYRACLDTYSPIADETIFHALTLPTRVYAEIYDANLSWIVPGGETQIQLRINHDVDNITPINNVQEYSLEMAGPTEGTNRAYLEVWYVA